MIPKLRNISLKECGLITLAKKQCRLDIRKFSFLQRTLIEWKRLSADCLGASSANLFKTKPTYT